MFAPNVTVSGNCTPVVMNLSRSQWPLSLSHGCVCAFILGLWYAVCRQWPCDGLILHPTSLTSHVYDYETEKVARTQQMTIDLLINE